MVASLPRQVARVAGVATFLALAACFRSHPHTLVGLYQFEPGEVTQDRRKVEATLEFRSNLTYRICSNITRNRCSEGTYVVQRLRDDDEIVYMNGAAATAFAREMHGDRTEQPMPDENTVDLNHDFFWDVPCFYFGGLEPDVDFCKFDYND
jgi:hypothetical protein